MKKKRFLLEYMTENIYFCLCNNGSGTSSMTPSIVYPIEIKKTKSPNKSMIKNFSILNKGEKEIGEGGLICMIDRILPLDNKNIAIPIHCI